MRVQGPDLRHRVEPLATHSPGMLTVHDGKPIVGPYTELNLVENIDTSQLTHQTDWKVISCSLPDF